MDECHRLRRPKAELIEVSGAICERCGTDRRPAESGKGGARRRIRGGGGDGAGSDGGVAGKVPMCRLRPLRRLDMELCRRALPIVDLFHAKEHLFEVAKAIYGFDDYWKPQASEQ